MKVLKDGKEVKGAVVVYDMSGVPMHVTKDGINYAVSSYELVEDEPVKKTKPASKTKDSSILTTKDVKKK